MGGSGLISKENIRQNALRLKRQISDSEYKRRSRQIAGFTVDFILTKGLKTIHTYLPIFKNREPDTNLTITKLQKSEVKIMVSHTDFKTETMTHFWYDNDLDLSLDQFGIPEPVKGNQAKIEEAECILVPLVCADKAGNRIGYGKGYYDKLLEPIKDQVIKIGLSILPAFESFNFNEDHDIKMDYIITPSQIISTDTFG